MSFGEHRGSSRQRHDEMQCLAGDAPGSRRSLHRLGVVSRQCLHRPVVVLPHAIGRQGELENEDPDGFGRGIGCRGNGHRDRVGQPASAGTATGSVTFSLLGASGPSLTCAGGDTVALVAGAGTCTINAAVSPGSPYVVTATYSGDAPFNASASNTRTIRVR